MARPNYNYFDMNFNQLSAVLMSGQVTERRLREIYTQQRRAALSNIRNINRAVAAGESALGFANGEQPYFPKAANLITTRDLLAALADVNRFRSRAYGSVSIRRKRVEGQIETLQSHGFAVDESNFLQWANFIRWFKASSWAAKYDSNDEVVQDAFESLSHATSAEWNSFFQEYTAVQQAQQATTGG